MAAITLLANGSRTTALSFNETTSFTVLVDGRPVVPDVWSIYANAVLVASGAGTDIVFKPTQTDQHTIHIIAQHPNGYAVEGVFVYSISTRAAGVATFAVRWDRAIYREKDDLSGVITSIDPEGLTAKISAWTLKWNNRVMSSGSGQIVNYRGLYHGLWRLEVRGVDFFNVPISSDTTLYVQPSYERRDATVPQEPDGTLVYLGAVYSGVINSDGGPSTTLPFQIASYSQVNKLLPGTTHVYFDIDPSYNQIDDEAIIRSHTGNYAVFGRIPNSEYHQYDCLPNDYLPAPADQQMRYTVDVYNTSGAFYTAINFRVRVKCYRLVPSLYRYSQCPYSLMPGGAGKRQRRWALLFEKAELNGVQFQTQPVGNIPLTTLTASGLPYPINSLTQAFYTESNLYATYERNETPDLDAKAICAIEGLRPFCLAIQAPANQPEFQTVTRLTGKMYVYMNGAAITQGSTVNVRIEGGAQDTILSVPVTADVYNPSDDVFVLVGAVDVDLSDAQFNFNGVVAWVTCDETTAVDTTPGTLPTPAWGPQYVYSGTFNGTVARGVSLDGACYGSPMKMTVVDTETASVVSQTTGCADPSCGPTGVYCYIGVCPPNACVQVTQPLYNPAPYVAYGSNPSKCYQLPEFVREGSVSGDFIPVSGDLCGDAYRYLRCDLKDTAIVVYPCATIPHGYVQYGADCYALQTAVTSYGTVTTVIPVGSVSPVSSCTDVVCTGSNAAGDAFVYFDTQTDDKIPVLFEGLAAGVPTFGVAPAKVDYGSSLTDGAVRLRFDRGRVQFLRVSGDGLLTIDTGLLYLNKKVVVLRGNTELVYSLPINQTTIDLTVQNGDRLLLDISVFGAFTKRLMGVQTIVKWAPKVNIPRLYDTAYGSVAGTYAISALGFTGPVDRTEYEFYGTIPSDVAVSVVNPDSLVTVQGVTVPTPEYALLRVRAVGEPVPPTPNVQWYAGQTFTGQVQFNFYALRNKQASHGEMDVWFSTAGDFPNYLLAQPWRALVRDERSYRCDADMALATRNAFAAETGLGGAQLPNVYADPVTGRVISSKSSSYRIRQGATTYTRKRQDTGIAGQVNASDNTQIVWAHLSDYGFDYPQRTDISNLVHGWNPDFIVAAGDNWQSGATNSLTSLDNKTGAYYHDFIFPYIGAYGAGATEQRFFACPGNHDWTPPGGGPIVPGTYRIPMFMSYFNLTALNYEVVKWPVHFFLIDNTDYMWDGDSSVTSRTAVWLQQRLAASTAPWKVVVAHYGPWASGVGHIMYTTRRWPFKAWGADMIISGHTHIYERFMFPDGFMAITCGTCNPAYWSQNNPALIWNPLPTQYSTFGYGVAPQLAGTCRFTATARALTLEYITTASALVDSVTLTK